MNPRDRDRRPPESSRTDRSDDQNAFRRVAIDQVSLASEPRIAPMVRKRRTIRAPFSPRSTPPVRQHDCGALLGQRRAADLPCGSPDVATRDALDRLLPPHFFVSVPAHRWLSLRRALARQRSGGDRLLHDSATHFSGPAQTCLSARLIASGVFFPPRCVHALPLTPLSPLPRAVTLAREDS